jgi:hypothetical protein
MRALCFAITLSMALSTLASGRAKSADRIVGLYVHQHWPYNHPYAARTWTFEDWKGFAGGLKQLGYNTILVWPMMEVMPDPPTPSDVAYLKRMERVVKMLHKDLGMRVFVVLCPNIVAKDEIARGFTFEKRHYFHCEDLLNPADPVAVGKMMARREKLVRHFKEADGLVVIDSDPGGYPGSTIAEYVSLLSEHRKMLDRIRPGIELVYWLHAGWRGWSKMYEIGKISFNTPAEYDETIERIKTLNPEPWGMANGLDYAKKAGVADRVMAFNYGRVEGEPSFPLTNMTGKNAHEGASTPAPRGVMGNAQTHCVQLPNIFAFARGAKGLPVPEEADYLAFAEKLIPGQGALIVKAWNGIGLIAKPAEQRAIAEELDALPASKLKHGELGGLLFGSSKRFVGDLAHMLRYRAAIEELVAAQEKGTGVKDALRNLVRDAGAWQKRHGYENNWYEPRMSAALVKLNHPAINAVYQIRYELTSPPPAGQWAFEQIRKNFAEVESLTPRLLEAIKKAAEDMK